VKGASLRPNSVCREVKRFNSAALTPPPPKSAPAALIIDAAKPTPLV